MLIDKGYYDYDYKFIEKPVVAESTVMSDDKLQKVMSKFGFGSRKKDIKSMNMEELQSYAMKQIEKQ